MYKKKKLITIINTLQEANEELRNRPFNTIEDIVQMLTECQELAIRIGTDIDEREDGLGKEIVHFLEEYCEQIYQLSLNPLDKNVCKKYTKVIRNSLTRIKNSVENELPEDKPDIVFFPYKASMWDSLESIWMAANEDESCNAIVVPIPYFEKNTGNRMYYEGNDFPDYVPIISWEQYNLELEHPEVVYFHNPYDDYNFVTSVHPNYYARNMKPHTDCLVYVPYYSTSGGMSEGQSLLPSYLIVDYIVIQAPKLRNYFDTSIPDEKFLPLGSPKFDRVIKKCQNPPNHPRDWKDKMGGKKVYLYNTSINGMLENTLSFLQKMEYVFECFKKQKDACLLWRPHPLLESTLASMRPQLKPYYNELKKRFVDENLGIYDDTPDITNSIALSDVYVGDAASSITSLFGIAGKPLFLLNNYIHSEPGEEDWRGEIITGFNPLNEDDRWMVTQGNKLYYSEPGKYEYHYSCNLSEYSSGNYYQTIKTIDNIAYICPINAQDILAIKSGKVIKKIELIRRTDKGSVFCSALKYEQDIILIPVNYRAIVRYNTATDKITYYTENVDIFSRKTNDGIKNGGVCIFHDFLLAASPIDNLVYALNLRTNENQVIQIEGNKECGSSCLVVDEDEIWILPRQGYIVKRWNPVTGRVQEYEVFPEELKCIQPFQKQECLYFPFGYPAVTKDALYLPANWGNIYARIDKKTGRIEKWSPKREENEVNEYYLPSCGSYYIREEQDGLYTFFSVTDRKLYKVNLDSGECLNIDIKFDKKELELHESGFSKSDEWLQYCCKENAINSLGAVISGYSKGNVFNKEEQIKAYENVVANADGTCGKKTHEYVMAHLRGENK